MSMMKLNKPAAWGMPGADPRFSAPMKLNAYERHVQQMRLYGRAPAPLPPVRTDADVLRDNFRFIRDDKEDMRQPNNWEVGMARKYYNKLFKEYCIADMSRYKDGRVGMRWRTKEEVVYGKGQFVCGNKECKDWRALRSFEVNFKYKEAGDTKNALVKMRVCPECAFKLNYRKYKQLPKRQYEQTKRTLLEAKQRGAYLEDLKTSEPAAAAPAESGSPSSSPSKRERDSKAADRTEKRHKVADDGSDWGKKPEAPEEPAVASQVLAGGDTIWKQAPQADKTAADEFDEYFEGMFP